METTALATARRFPEDPLERRLDEIQGLLREPLIPDDADLSSPATLSDLALILADRVERGHRQLIETSVQLTSLREVAHRLLSVRSADRAAETIALYLHKAFDHGRVAVLLFDRDALTLRGTAIRRAGLGFFQAQVGLPIVGAQGAVPATFNTGEARLIETPTEASLYDGEGDLASAFDLEDLGSMVIAPLKAAHLFGSPVSSGIGRPADETVGPVDPRHTILGLILVGRCRRESPLTGDDLAQIESVATTLSTVVENGRLYQDLRQGEMFRDDLLNSMGSGLVAINLARRAISMNQTAVGLTGWEITDVLGDVPPFLPVADRGMDAAIRGASYGKPVLRKEVVLSRKDGTFFPASVSTSPLRNEDGEIYGVIATFQDLTVFKDMEERIRQLDRLAALGRFTAAIAHEIRNPLAGISAGVEYLTKGMSQAGDAADNIKFIQTEIQRLNQIIEDLFRVTHPRPLMTSPERPEAILERSLRCLGDMAKERRIEVVRILPDSVPPVPVDADQIQQVAINLIKNALEAMEPGGTLTLRTGTRPGRPGEEPWVTLSVADTGPGMNAEVRKRLFEPFFTKKASGTGLGLYICHGIVERHGGLLRVDSVEGEGSTFTVELPRTPVSNGGAQ
jgi:PAS domain S-box-containing protein